MEKEESKRIYWIDAAKIIAMVLIVLSHTIAYSDKLQGLYKYVSSFHVALFFTISGLTFSINKYCNFKKFFKTKFKRIMIPYLVFAVLFLIPFLILGATIASNLNRNDIDINLKHSIIGIFYGNGNDNYLRQNSSLWFLPCLFVTEMIFYFVEKNKNKNKYYITILFSIVIGMLDYYFLPFRMPWGFDIAICMLAFFALGKIISNRKSMVIKNNVLTVCISLTLIIIGGIIQCFNTNVMYMHNEYGNYFIFIISAFFSVIGYTFLISKIHYNKVLDYAGKRTMAILIFHKIFVLVFQTKITPISNLLKTGNVIEQIVCSIIVVIISIVLSLIIEIVVNKICPWMLGNIKKERKYKK